jgi:hypothetical protein
MARIWIMSVIVGLMFAGTGLAAARADDFGQVQDLSLAAAQAKETRTETTAKENGTTTKETTTVRETRTVEEGWDIWGPVTLRSADPEELGEVEIKNIYHYGTSSDGSHDANDYEFEIEYGIAPNHELIFAVPDVSLNRCEEEGNGNLEAGWHWRLWKEQDWIPAFALRNILLIPSGYHSSGLDWTLRGLLTKSIIENKWRLHLNPFLTVASGSEPEELRHFQWGFIVGTDYRLCENVNLQLDYIHRTSEEEGERNQHSMEAGVEWQVAEHHGIAFATNWTVDGDSVDENWGFTVSYVFSFDAPAFGKNGG